MVDVGERQRGREHGGNVVHVPPDAAAIRRALSDAQPWRGGNVYGGDGTGRRIADKLAAADLSPAALRKLIAY